MKIIYILMIIVVFIPGLAPVCSNLRTYPTALYWCNVLFIVNACFFWVMYKKNFFRNLSETDNEKYPLISGENAHHCGDHAHHCGENAHQRDKSRLIFKDQMQTYNCFTVVLSISQIVVIFVGEVFISKGGYLTCTGGGYQWLYQNLAGEAFIFMTMINMMLQSFLIEKFLYSVPHQHGYFEEEKDDFRAAHSEGEMVAINN
jgi:hypothetical protein